MNLTKHKHRIRLQARLSDGTGQARISEARKALPVIAGTLQRVRDRKAAARDRFLALRDSSGRADTTPTVNPALYIKVQALRIWPPILLLVEVAIASYVATLTISGGWWLHLITGLLATALLCGLGKVAVTAFIDSERIEASARGLERQLRVVVIAAGLLLVGFFIARFLPEAEFVFAVASTGLSFLVAYLVALSFTLGKILSISHTELDLFTRLSWVESDLVRLQEMAQALLDEPKAQLPAAEERERNGLAAVAIALLSVMAPAEASLASDLTLWVDVSGSLEVTEWERVRGVLSDPHRLLEATDSTHLALAPFATEMDILAGTRHRWGFPVFDPPVCEVDDTVFMATRKAQETACAEALAQAEAEWQRNVAAMLTRYQEVLHAIDVGAPQAQTCLFPLLERLASSSGSHIVITDGGHAQCGDPPVNARAERIGAAVILLPDSEGEGLADRMRTRTALLHDLYPGIAIVPSWQVHPDMDWQKLFSQLQTTAEVSP